MIRRLTRRRGEEGTALILALAFLILFSLVIAALLEGTFVGAKNISVTRSRTEKLYAADAGIEWGIEEARTNAAACPTVTGIEQTLTSTLPLNDVNLTVQCENLVGQVASPAGQNWAVATDSLTSASINPVWLTGGDVYDGGPLSLTGDLNVVDGDLIQGAIPCDPLAQPGHLVVGVPNVRSCSTSRTFATVAQDVANHIVLPPLPTGSAPAAQLLPCGGRNWKVLHQGRYTSGVQFDPVGATYLESGVYYLDNIGHKVLENVRLVGGQRPSGDDNVLRDSCVPDTYLGTTYSGQGVTLILGGNSSLELRGNTRFELFSRVPTDSSTPGISIIGLNTPAANYTPWTGGNLLAYGFSLFGTPVEAAVHGLVYGRGTALPSVVTVNPGCSAPLLGGVIASQVVLPLDICVTGAPLQAVRARGRRTLLLTSTTSGGNATTESAVVTIANDPARTATVRSWRVQ